jgi:SAM-dependent methyltransferase
MYDSLSADYDYFVNWAGRLPLEMPFIEAQLRSVADDSRPLRVLDAACGTGMHAIELARRGYAAAGADLSAGMIERAAANAAAAGVQVRFEQAGFGDLAGKFSGFDALLCLGNSLPHLLTSQAMALALSDFAACLRPGGLLLVQNRNFDAVLAHQERWMAPEYHHAGEREWLFLRFYDFDPDGLLTFHIITLSRLGQSGWQQKVDSTWLYPQRQAELAIALGEAGFERITSYGNMTGALYDPMESSNLVLTARLAGGRQDG